MTTLYASALPLIADGSADDQTPLQAAIDAAGQGVKLLLDTDPTRLLALGEGKGRSRSSLVLPHGTHLIGTRAARAALRRRPDLSKFARMIDCQGDAIIEGLDLDGNLGAQGQWQNSAKEHQALIYATGGKVTIRRCRLRSTPGDGIHCHDDAVVHVEDCTFADCVRGAITPAGRRSRVTVVRCTGAPRLIETRPGVWEWTDGINHEPDPHGQGPFWCHLTLDGGQWGQLGMALYDAAQVTLRAARFAGGGFAYGHGGRLHLERCAVGEHITGRSLALQIPGTVTVKDCDLQGHVIVTWWTSQDREPPRGDVRILGGSIERGSADADGRYYLPAHIATNENRPGSKLTVQGVAFKDPDLPAVAAWGGEVNVKGVDHPEPVTVRGRADYPAWVNGTRFETAVQVKGVR